MAQNDVEQLRASNQVVLVSQDDAGRRWSKIANGVYGFTYTPASEDGGLFISRPRQCFEVHKLADGSLHIVGFTTPERATRLKSSGAQDLEIYPDPRGLHTSLVTVAQSRIASSKALDRDDFNLLKLNLKPTS